MKDIEIYDVSCEAYEIDDPHIDGEFRIQWSGSIGFGELELQTDKKGKVHIFSECMCTNDNREFAKLIMEKVINEAVIEG